MEAQKCLPVAGFVRTEADTAYSSQGADVFLADNGNRYSEARGSYPPLGSPCPSGDSWERHINEAETLMGATNPHCRPVGQPQTSLARAAG